MSDTSFAVFEHYGTNAQRLAFTPSPPATGQPIYTWYESDTDTAWIYTTSWHQISGSGGGVTASGTLTANRVILGAGTSVVTALGSLGTTTTVLHGNAGGAPSFATVVEADITLADNTTDDVSTSKHGFAPKAPNNVGLLLRGDATWANVPYLQYWDQETQNTAGGGFTSGAWRTRVLNTEVFDTDNLGTLASNQVTLAAGTYEIRASAPAFGVDRHQLRLQNTTDATTLIVGTSAYANNSSPVQGGVALLSGRFTVAASKALELQHQCQTTRTTNGLGLEANFTTEIYAVVELWRVG